MRSTSLIVWRPLGCLHDSVLPPTAVYAPLCGISLARPDEDCYDMREWPNTHPCNTKDLAMVFSGLNHVAGKLITEEDRS